MVGLGGSTKNIVFFETHKGLWGFPTKLGGGFLKDFLFFTPLFGEDEPILTSIFFKGGEITN